MAEDRTPVTVVELSNDDYAELYGRICDLVERNYQGYPLDDDELGLTSDQAREVASRIFALVGVVRAKPAGAVEPPEWMDEAERQFYWASYHVHGGDADKMRAYADRLFVYRDVHLHVVPADGGDQEEEPVDEEVLEIIEEAVGEYLDWEARPKAEINEAAEMCFDLAWLRRHLDGTSAAEGPEVADAIVATYGLEAVPTTDYDVGKIHGRLAALRWVLGDEWEDLST